MYDVEHFRLIVDINANEHSIYTKTCKDCKKIQRTQSLGFIIVFRYCLLWGNGVQLIRSLNTCFYLFSQSGTQIPHLKVLKRGMFH